MIIATCPFIPVLIPPNLKNKPAIRILIRLKQPYIVFDHSDSGRPKIMIAFSKNI